MRGRQFMKDYSSIIRIYSKQNYLQMTRSGTGILKHPFIVPGSQSYSDCLWDWDSWLTNVAVRQIMLDNGTDATDFASCEKGCILNFLEHTAEDGKMPICIFPDRVFPELNEGQRINIHKPCLAQHAAFVVQQNGGDAIWLAPHLDKLQAYIGYYQTQLFHKETGLYFWHDDTAIGVDNDPSIFYRPDDSIASIFLNSLMYKELLAMAYICKVLGKDDTKYIDDAEHLKKAVNEHLWDERNGMYYSADLNLRPIDLTEYLHSGMPRHWSSVIIRIDSWSSFMAMWAGLATPERAKRMVYENMLKPELFWSNYGVCTLAKTEKMYRIIKSGNPSCWLGPIWGISNYMCYRGLKNYGFDAEAKDLAEKTIRLFGQDIEACGELNEYYHPDTGEGVNNPGFQNWNLLVNNMIAEQEGRLVVKEF